MRVRTTTESSHSRSAMAAVTTTITPSAATPVAGATADAGAVANGLTPRRLTGVRVGRSPWREGVGCQIERVADDDLGALRSDELPDLEEIRTRLVFGGQHERLVVCRAIDQTEGRRDDIHLPVADKDVAVAPEELDRLVLVDVAAAGVEKVTVADDEIDHWIPVAVGLFRIENSVMSQRRDGRRKGAHQSG